MYRNDVGSMWQCGPESNSVCQWVTVLFSQCGLSPQPCIIWFRVPANTQTHTRAQTHTHQAWAKLPCGGAERKYRSWGVGDRLPSLTGKNARTKRGGKRKTGKANGLGFRVVHRMVQALLMHHTVAWYIDKSGKKEKEEKQEGGESQVSLLRQRGA